MLKDVIEAHAAGGQMLWVRFQDGCEGTVDVARMVEFREVFAPLADPVVFAQVRVDSEIGTVVWPNGADLDPDVLHAEVTGEPIVFLSDRATATR